MAVSHINGSTITPKNNNYFKHNNYPLITAVGCGALISLGGVFLLLAAYQVLPQGANFVSRLGLVNKVVGGAYCLIGISLIGYTIKNRPRIEKNRPKVDHSKKLPQRMFRQIFGYLKVSDLLVANSVNSHWKGASNDELVWKSVALKKMSPELANVLFESRQCWKKVIADLYHPAIVKKSDRLSKFSDHILLASFTDRLPERLIARIRERTCEEEPELYGLMLCSGEDGSHNFQLQKAWDVLVRVGRIRLLNTRILKDGESQTCLEFAAKHGLIENARFLIEKGAKDKVVSVRNNAYHGVFNSALRQAMNHGHTQMVKFLLEEGATFGYIYDRGQSINLFTDIVTFYSEKMENQALKPAYVDCLLLAIQAEKEQLGTQKFLNQEFAKSALEIALCGNNLIIPDLLILMGITLDAKIVKSILVRAVREKNLSKVEYIHRRGLLDLRNLRLHEGSTILHLCASQGADEILEFLIGIGVPKDVQNNAGETYQVFGKKEYSKMVCRIIANQRFQPGNFCDPETRFKVTSLQDCFARNPDLNIDLNDNGDTALHKVANFIIALYKENEIISLLLQYGADPHLPNKRGETPFSIAKKTFHENREEIEPEEQEKIMKLLDRMEKMKT